jgi:hypothetical protein
MPKTERHDPILGKDISWNAVDMTMLRVLEFSPISTVEGTKVKSSSNFVPYAFLTVESIEKTFNGRAVLYVTNRQDFTNLWRVFKEIGIKQDEDVVVVWSKKMYANWIYKVLSVFMPKMVVMVYRKESIRLIIDNDYQPELEGIERLEASLPVIHLKPKVIEGSNLAAA